MFESLDVPVKTTDAQTVKKQTIKGSGFGDTGIAHHGSFLLFPILASCKS